MILSVGTAPTLPASNKIHSTAAAVAVTAPAECCAVQKDDMCHTVTIYLYATAVERNGTLQSTQQDVGEGTSLLGDLIIIIKVDTFHRSCYVANAILILAGLSSHPSSRSFADLQECEGVSR